MEVSAGFHASTMGFWSPVRLVLEVADKSFSKKKRFMGNDPDI
jgi:hypothetical protein